MPFSTFGQRVQSHTPSNYRLYHSLISKLEIFRCFSCLPHSLFCYLSRHSFVMACCSVWSDDVAFSGVFKDMFFPKYLLKVLRKFENSFKWHMKRRAPYRLHHNKKLWSFEMFYKNCKYSYLNTQLQSLNSFYDRLCVLSATLWYIKDLVYFYGKH